MKRYKQPSRSKRKPIIIALIILGVLAAVFAILELTNVTSVFNKKETYKAPRTVNSETKGEGPSQQNTKDPNQNGSTNQDGTWPSDNKAPEGNDSGDTSAKLIDPTGNFVSNHRPNLDGSPAPNTMQSSCVTTPGATCQIIFTKGSTVKGLAAQKTDAGGGAYWTWKLQDLGITEGTWTIEAKATLGSQTATAKDALNLEVAQ